MQGKDVKACTSFVAFDCNGTAILLNREVVSYGAGAISDEGLSVGEATSRNKVVEKIV